MIYNPFFYGAICVSIIKITEWQNVHVYAVKHSKLNCQKKFENFLVNEKINDTQAHQYNWKIYYLIVILNHYLFIRIRNKI